MIEDNRKYYKPINPTNSVLNCKICCNLAVDPIECPKCEQLFCTFCVKKQKDKQDKCPEQCQGTFETRQPHRMVKDQFSKIVFYCANKDQGCQEQIIYEQVMKHNEQCSFKIIQCQCGWQGIKKLLQEHKEKCDYYKVDFCKICKQEMSKINLQIHNCFEDLKQDLLDITDRFCDIKDQYNNEIKILQANKRQKIIDKRAISDQIIKLKNENKQLKEQINILLINNKKGNSNSNQNSPQKQQTQQNYQQIKIQNGQLIGQKQAICQKNHTLQFWVKPNGEDKQKTCGLCQKKQINCRYICNQCNIFICFKCIYPEVKIDKAKYQTFCPGNHQMKKIENQFICQVCNKNSENLLNPIAAYCEQCDFIECQNCLTHKKYFDKNQDCHVQ